MNAHFGIDFKTARVKGSRKNGNNLRDKAAYATRENQFADRADDLALAGSANLPDWATDADDFWQAAEANDFGRTATNIRLDLPRNLSRPRQLKAIETFIQQQLANRPTSWGWHIDEAADGGDNTHVHILASNRVLDGIDRDREQFFKRYNTKEPERGGARKTYFSGGKTARKDQWQGFRSSWAEILNKELKAEGLPLVDARSLSDQGIDREPQKKRGYNQNRAAEQAAQEALEAQKTAVFATAKASAAKDLRTVKTRRKTQAADVAPELTASAERTARQTVRKRRRRVRAQKSAENSLSSAKSATPGKAGPALTKAAKDLARNNLTPKREPRIRKAPEERVQKMLQKALFTRKPTATIPGHIALNATGKSPEMEKWMRGIYRLGKEPHWIKGGPQIGFTINIPELSRAIIESKTPVRQFASNTLAAFKRAGLLMAGIVRQRPKTAENSHKNGKQTGAQKAWGSNYKPKKTKDIDLSDL